MTGKIRWKRAGAFSWEAYVGNLYLASVNGFGSGLPDWNGDWIVTFHSIDARWLRKTSPYVKSVSAGKQKVSRLWHLWLREGGFA